MTWLHIGDELFGDARLTKAERLVVKLGIPIEKARAVVIGWLAQLWHESQPREVIFASKEQIDVWTTDEDALSILLESRFILKNGDLFEIVGNKNKIDGIIANRQQRVNAGLESARKRQRPVNDRSTTVNDRSTTVNDRSTVVNECSTVVNDPDPDPDPKNTNTPILRIGSQPRAENGSQCVPDSESQSVDLDASEKIRKAPNLNGTPEDDTESHPTTTPAANGKRTRNLTKPKKTNEKSGSAIFNAYSIAYRERYGVEPLRDALTNSLCAKLAARTTTEEAQAVARYYLSINKDYYLGKGHDIRTLSVDFDSIRLQMLRGTKHTSTSVKQADVFSHNAECMERVLRKLEREELENKKTL